MKAHKLALAASLCAGVLSAAPPEWSASRACAACHPAIYARYSRTAMANSGGRAGAGDSPERFGKASFADSKGVHLYSVRRHEGRYWLDIRLGGDSPSLETRLLRYFIGSGASARSYLIDVDGFLYEAPVTWYGQSGKWSFSPGYEQYTYPFLTRAITPPCLQCHTSGVRAIPDTQNGYESPPFLEGGVSCERCHGPGAAHVRSAKKSDIVNPAALEPGRRDSVCAQCHLSGEVRIDRPGKKGEFLAGENLSDYAIAFVRATSSPRMKVTSQAENLAQSACKRASGDRMWCASCHDPHSPPSPPARVEWFRSKCLACHAGSACKGNTALRVENKDDCTVCHMPKQPVSDAAHVAYTDHSIPRRALAPDRKRPEPVSAAAPLVPLGSQEAEPRELGLAYAIVALRDQNAGYRNRAFDLLRDAQRTQPNDPQTLSYLADLYKGRSDEKEAAHLYELLLPLHPAQASAPAALGAYQMEQGHYEEAIRLWKKALQISPALLLVRVNLAIALLRTGHREEARATLVKALEFNPEFPAALKLLGELK
jgi:predicted Zn-dependent protease